MAKDPAFLFYPGDFNTGTQFFSDEQVGKYIRLLMAQHQHGHLTDDQVIHICKSYDNHVMSKFLKDSGGLWYNKRLEEEVLKRKRYSESRSENKLGKTHISKSHDPHMENVNRIEDRIKEALNEILIENLRPLYGHLDFDKEIEGFKAKVIGSPQKYGTYDVEALGLAFMAQLRNGKHKPKEKSGSEFDEKEVLKRIKNQQPQKTDGVGSATSKPGSLE